MAKLPGVLDVGGVRAEGSRPVGALDTSGFARAGAAVGQGLEALGRGVAKLGEGVTDLEVRKGRYEYAQAHAEQLAEKIRLYDEARDDTDFATMTDRYKKRIGEATAKAAERISNPWMRERFETDMTSAVTQFNSNIAAHARKLEGENNVAYVAEQGDKFIDAAIATADETTRAEVIDSHRRLVDGLAARGFVSATQAVEMKKRWAERYAAADVLSLIDTDPGEAVRRIEAAGGESDKSIYKLLPPERRMQLLHQARTALRTRDGKDLVGFKQQVEDTESQAARSGDAVPVPREDFVRRLGEDAGGKAYDAHLANVQLGRDVATVAALDPNEQAALIERYAPTPGAEGYALQARRQDVLAQAIAKVNQEKARDPAQFAIARLPSVQQAYTAFNQVLTNPAAPLEVKQQAARTFADTMLMEQQRVGVPAAARRIVPNAYIDDLNRKLTQPAREGGATNVAAQIATEAAIWGDKWPAIYRDLNKTAIPVVRVIGSGVKPTAAALLSELGPTPLNDILKGQDEEKLATVRSSVLIAFKPFAATMAGNEGAAQVFNDFRIQGEKLTAYYVTRGMTADDAAAKAFDDLVGFKYDFRDTYRIPKDAGYAAVDIAAGAHFARRNLARYDIAPARDTVGGLSPDYLASATVNALARDGVWVTAPDETGLALIHGDRAVRRTDGSPLILKWSELAALGNRDAAERAVIGGGEGAP